MLGFGGHFATKSRTYSTTFGALRQERADFTARQDPYTLALTTRKTFSSSTTGHLLGETTR